MTTMNRFGLVLVSATTLLLGACAPVGTTCRRLPAPSAPAMSASPMLGNDETFNDG